MLTMYAWIYSTVVFLGCALFIAETTSLQRTGRSSLSNEIQTTQKAVDGTFYNVIVQTGADPWVYKHTDGWYYMTRTTGGDVRIWRSRTFTSFDASISKVIWSSPRTGPACSDVWAPEIHFIESAWYVYFTATTCNRNGNNRRMFVLENTNANPFNGSFIFKGQITDVTNKWAIDGTVFKHPSGQLYYMWSGWEGDVNIRQILYIAALSNPWTISSQRVEIARPLYKWETNHFPYVNEGPQVIIHNDVISLVYSASGSWTNDYCLGLITTSTSSNPLNASSWVKYPNPIFKSANDVFGPGHHSFTKSPDGSEDWIIYHSARYNRAGWSRQIRAQPFTWNTNSTPNLGQPIDRNTRIQIPSGDPVRNRYEAEDAMFLNSPYVISDTTASNKIKVGPINDANNTVTFIVQCAQTASYVIAIRNANGSPSNTTATQWLSINNGTRTKISAVYSGWNMWGVTMFSARLLEGVNSLTLQKADNLVELDTIDIYLNVQ